MAEAATRSTTNTELVIAGMSVGVSMFSTNAKESDARAFDVAGPNGKRLVNTKDDPKPDLPVLDALSDEPIAVPHGADHVVADAGFQATAHVPFENYEYEEGDEEKIPVHPDSRLKGLFLDDDKFVDLGEQLDAITEHTKLDRMEIVATIDSTSIRRSRVVASAYLGVVNAKDDFRLLRLLYEGLRTNRQAAVVKWTTRTRQKLGIIIPDRQSETLILLSLVWAKDWRPAPARALAIKQAAVNASQVEKFADILKSMREEPAVVDMLSDDALVLRDELYERTMAGEMFPTPATPQEVMADNLAAALETAWAEADAKAKTEPVTI